MEGCDLYDGLGLTGVAEDLAYLRNPIWWAGMITSKLTTTPLPLTRPRADVRSGRW